MENAQIEDIYKIGIEEIFSAINSSERCVKKALDLRK